jgi:lipopolysaccharide export system protein LptA
VSLPEPPRLRAAARRPAVARVLVLAALAVAPVWSAASAQGFQHDSTLPIEITADRLDVVQDEQLATFTGNVDAVQGDLVLTSDLLRVYYRSSDAAPGIAAGSIRRIEAEGNVFITSPEETAEGEFGVYDVEGGLLTLEGSVVLTRDQNVVRGERLEIELASGRSQMFAAVPSTAGGTAGQRVKAVFVPPSDPVEPGAGPAGTAASEDGAADAADGAADGGEPAPAEAAE